ncbi:MAG: TM2 domain-containing protein [Gemmatimonadetes bacterium]|nr:TM2 domain-containing protein [Gemmatimonadota bacterium]
MRGVALGIGIPLGVFGAHRFYVGKVGTGLLQLCTFGGMGLWWLYDMILIASGEFRDSDGRRLGYWSRDEMQAAKQSPPPGAVMDEIEAVHVEVHELAERVDFLERMLAQAREKGQLGPGGR